MSDVIVIREWDADSFHRRVLELERGDTSPGGRLIGSLRR